MIQERSSTHHIEGSLSGERVAMQIDEAAHAHIMTILTDLYADPVAAVVREYATNAWDAHREAGINRPIDVTLPVRFSPVLRVRDYGVGLDAEGIRDVYSKYGASTKRATNDQVGMLGLGCKSALTYCDQFTVVGVKGGRRVQVAIGRDENGVGVMTIVSDEPTDDPSGVDVVVPVKLEDVADFGQRASEFFCYWNPKDVLVNGEAPTPADDGALDLGNDISLIETGPYDRRPEHVLVMGNVAYPCPLAWENAPRSVSIVARVPIGSISIPPNRESVMDTPLTRHTWEKVVKQATAGMEKAVQANIDAAPDRGAAIDVREQWATKLRVDRSKLTYKGEPMPESVVFADRQKPGWEAKCAYAHDRTGAQKHASKEWEIPVSWMRRNIVVLGWDRPSFTETQAKKLRMWLDQSRLRGEQGHYADLRSFLLVRNARQLNGERKWLDPARIVDWADINALKLERSSVSNRSGRPSGSYDVLEADGAGGYSTWHHYTADQIEQATKTALYHVQGNRYQSKRNLLGVEKGALVVCLPMNRVAKYERYFTESLPLLATMEARAKAWVKGLTAADKRALSVHQGSDFRTLQGLDPAKVDDPSLKQDILTAKRNIDALKQAKRQHEKHLGYDGVEIPSRNPVRDSYRLIAGTYLDTKDEHVYTYINAVYSQEAS